ncbi:MAG: hypothetical protein RI973_1630 [Bacteroidota bacterium]
MINHSTMFRNSTISSTCFPALILLATACSLHAQPSDLMSRKNLERTYLISRNSKLTLEGKTNVNIFSCNCTESFAPQAFSFREDGNETTGLVFQRTGLKLSVKNLDCGNKLMNKDLQKALNADNHPYIQIELLKIKEDQCKRPQGYQDWVKIKALTRLTINGQCNDYWIDILARKTSSHHFRFIGSKKIQMTQFGVIPPTAMMGMVKVEDEIKIKLDLEVSLDEAI